MHTFRFFRSPSRATKKTHVTWSCA